MLAKCELESCWFEHTEVDFFYATFLDIDLNKFQEVSPSPEIWPNLAFIS